jgi:hypothetical protein
MDKDIIIARISARLGSDNIIDRLASIPTKDLNSLMIFLYEQRAGSLSVTDILKQSSESRFVKPADIPQRVLVFFDQLAYDLLPSEFEGIELSPLAPLGINSVLAGTDQKNVMAAIRNVEVVADPTTSLALECSKRRRELLKLGLGREVDVKLATSIRNVRVQIFTDIPGFKAHFRIFALATAGEEEHDSSFSISALGEHLWYYLSLFDRLSEHGYGFEDVTVSLSDIRITETLIKEHNLNRKWLGRKTQNNGFNYLEETGVRVPAFVSRVDELPPEEMRAHKIGYYVEGLKSVDDAVLEGLRTVFPTVNFRFDLKRLAGIGYYTDLCFKITAMDQRGESYPLVDGGTAGWTAQLLRSKKERLVVSGIGTEIVCQNFQKG